MSKIRLPTSALAALTLLWASALIIPLAQVSGAHYFPFLARPLTGLASDSAPRMDHFLGTTCGCSEKVLKYLEGRGSQVNEVVHIVGPGEPWASRLSERGFQVEVLSEDEALSRYQLESVPRLLISAAGETLYQGGYNEDQRHNSRYEDLRLWDSLARKGGAAVERSYPLYGCANGKLRKAQLDPWKMKYE